MNRRDFFRILGKAVVVGVAAKVAPEILKPAAAAPAGPEVGQAGVIGPIFQGHRVCPASQDFPATLDLRAFPETESTILLGVVA